MLARTVTAVRRPEYTGRNRCWPCTALNLCLALVAAGLVARLSLAAGGVALGLCAGAIYLRGYLVPGTPEFTRRYLPESVLRLFGKGPERPRGDGSDDSGGAASERLLREAGVVSVAADGDLRLDDSFRGAWRDRIEALRDRDTARERLAAAVGVDPGDLSFEEAADEFAVGYDGAHLESWPSRAAFVAELAAEPTLAERCAGWNSLDPSERARLVAGMRAFLDRCPTCDGPLVESEDVWESCCSEVVDVTVACADCGSRVFWAREQR